MKTLKNLALVLFSLLVFSCSEDTDVLDDKNAVEIDSKKIESIKNGLTAVEQNSLVNLVSEIKITLDKSLLLEVENIFNSALERSTKGYLNISKTSTDCMIDGLIAWVDTYNSAIADGASQDEANFVAEISERYVVRQCTISENKE